MPESFPFPMYSGLLSKDHRENIGPAIWEFLWCISKTTREEMHEDGGNWGIVLGGKPIKHSEIADELGSSDRTVKRNMARLKEFGYIETIRAPYGEIIKVRKSKKYAQKRSAKSGTSEREVTEMSLPDVPHMSDRSAKSGTSPDKNGTSNKDIIGDITRINNAAVVAEEPGQILSNPHNFKTINDNEGVPSTRDTVPTSELDADSSRMKISKSEYRGAVKDKYLSRRGKGLELSTIDYEALEELIQEQIPLTIVLEGIDKAFDEYKPKHKRDEIRTLNYCLPRIFDLHHIKSLRDSGSINKEPLSRSKPQGKKLRNVKKDPLPPWVEKQIRDEEKAIVTNQQISMDQQKEADRLMVQLEEMSKEQFYQKWGEGA